MIRAKRGNKDIDIDTLEKEAMETRVALTLGWGCLELGDDGELEFTEDNVRKVYTDFPWLAEQVDEFQGDRANFFTNN